MTLEDFKKIWKKMPETPGVYFFLDKQKKVLYIGKATILRDRVRSYFSKDLEHTRGPLLTSMIEKAKTVEWRQTDSVLEALILEANLIKNYRPDHNTDLKDDKSWNYVVLTKENFPRVLLVRGKNLEMEFPAEARLYTFGPFPHGLQLRDALKLIRKIFPYRDTCTPAEDMLKVGKKPKACFNAAIGMCPGVCSGAISKQEYRKIIRRIALLFQGKKTELLRSLTRDMKAYAKEEKFEQAAALRKQVYALGHIRDISLIKDEYRGPMVTLRGGTRIEAYDVAHLRGSSAVGVMVVVEDGLPMKHEYRKFNLKATKAGDDAGGLREILSRRLVHNEWPLPRLIVVDGSTAQINSAERVLDEAGVKIPIVGVTKDDKHRPRDLKGSRDLMQGREKEILLANAEAHRFAIGFHRYKSRKALI